MQSKIHPRFVERIADNCIMWAMKHGGDEVQRRAGLFSPSSQDEVTKYLEKRKKK